MSIAEKIVAALCTLVVTACVVAGVWLCVLFLQSESETLSDAVGLGLFLVPLAAGAGGLVGCLASIPVMILGSLFE